MKTVCLTLSAVTLTNAKSQLFNLRNAEMLPTAEKLSSMDSVAHLETFDPIPIYGGEALRDRMLEAERQQVLTEEEEATQGSFIKNLAGSTFGAVKRGFNSVTGKKPQSNSSQLESSQDGQQQQLKSALNTEAVHLKLADATEGTAEYLQ